MNTSRKEMFEDFTRDGVVCFGKYKGMKVEDLPMDYFLYLVAHYKFNLAVLNNHRPKK